MLDLRPEIWDFVSWEAPKPLRRQSFEASLTPRGELIGKPAWFLSEMQIVSKH